MKPSIGRIVLFHDTFSLDNFEHPAIITKVWSDTCVNLTIFANDKSAYCKTSVVQDEEMKQQLGWRWPPRV